jgi:hypothetical protein
LYKFTATANQTAFTGNDANGALLAFSGSDVDVYLNGVHLDSSDFSVSNGDTITLTSGAAVEPPPSYNSTVTVIEVDNILAMLRPIIVVSVEAGHVYRVVIPVLDVSMFLAVNVLNAFAICYPKAIAKANELSVKPCILLLASLNTIFSAGSVQNSVRVPDVQLTALSELLDCRMVVRASVVPEEVYVPIPTSKSVPSVQA